MYYKLLQWKENHDGDVLVGVDKDSDEDTKKLSRWVINQRSAYKYFMNGDTKHIKDHRIDALNKVGRWHFLLELYVYFHALLSNTSALGGHSCIFFLNRWALFGV